MRRQPTASQGERLRDKLTLTTLLSWTSSLLRWEKINLCGLSHPVFGHPWQTKSLLNKITPTAPRRDGALSHWLQQEGGFPLQRQRYRLVSASLTVQGQLQTPCRHCVLTQGLWLTLEDFPQFTASLCLGLNCVCSGHRFLQPNLGSDMLSLLPHLGRQRGPG